MHADQLPPHRGPGLLSFPGKRVGDVRLALQLLIELVWNRAGVEEKVAAADVYDAVLAEVSGTVGPLIDVRAVMQTAAEIVSESRMKPDEKLVVAFALFERIMASYGRKRLSQYAVQISAATNEAVAKGWASATGCSLDEALASTSDRHADPLDDPIIIALIDDSSFSPEPPGARAEMLKRFAEAADSIGVSDLKCDPWPDLVANARAQIDALNDFVRIFERRRSGRPNADMTFKVRLFYFYHFDRRSGYEMARAEELFPDVNTDDPSGNRVKANEDTVYAACGYVSKLLALVTLETPPIH